MLYLRTSFQSIFHETVHWVDLYWLLDYPTTFSPLSPQNSYWFSIFYILLLEIRKYKLRPMRLLILDKVFKSGLSKLCGRQPLSRHIPSNFLKAVFQKIYLVHSWILRLICLCAYDKYIRSISQAVILRRIKVFMSLIST